MKSEKASVTKWEVARSIRRVEDEMMRFKHHSTPATVPEPAVSTAIRGMQRPGRLRFAAIPAALVSFVVTVNSAVAQQSTATERIQQAERQIESSDPKARQQAVGELGKLGGDLIAATVPLRKALTDLDEEVRLAAANALANLGPSAAIFAAADLDRCLRQDTSARVRERAAQALAHMGPCAVRAVPGLITALKDNDATVRRQAADALGCIGPAARAAVPALLGLLEDTALPPEAGGITVGDGAVIALGQIEFASLQAVPRLLEALAKSSGRRKSLILQALARISPDSDAVQSAISVALRAEGDPLAQAGAAASVQRLGTGAVALLPDLLSVFKASATRAREEDYLILSNIFVSLSAMGEQAGPAAAQLVGFLRDRKNGRMPTRDASLRLAAISTLGTMGPSSRQAVPVLVAMLKDPNDRVEAGFGPSIIQALASIKDPAVPALIEMLRDSRSKCRRDALAALRRMGPAARAAIPSVKDCLEDPDPSIRDDARATLDRIMPRE